MYNLSNASHYSVFLDVHSIRPLAWIGASVGLPLNMFVICFMIYESSLFKSITRKSNRYNEINDICKNPSILLVHNLFISNVLISVFLLLLVVSDVYYTNYYQLLLTTTTNISYTNVRNEWFTSATCNAARFIARITNMMTVSITLIIAIDRFILTIYPHSTKKFTVVKSTRVLIGLWIGCIIIGGGITIYNIDGLRFRSPHTFDFFVNYCHGDYDRTQIHIIAGFVELAYYFIAYVIVIILYTIIIWKLRNSNRVFQSYASQTLEKRFLIMLFLIAGTNALAFFIVTITTAFERIYNTNTEFKKLVSIFINANVVIDPVLYLIFRVNGSFKKYFFVCCRKYHASKIIPISSNSQVQKSKQIEILA